MFLLNRRPVAAARVSCCVVAGGVGGLVRRGDDFAETEDVGVEVEADSGLSHAASGAARDVS